MIDTSTEFSSFGMLLKAFRQRQHFTQARLAQRLGVHRHAIGRWEQGDMLPASKTVVLELAKHLCLNDQEARHFLEASLTAPDPRWSVPLPRNPFFTGREEILKTLHLQLSGDQRVIALSQSAALHGLGGIGKTQIALEYAYRHALNYDAVFWIAAETEEQIVSSLVQTAEALHLPEQAVQDQQRLVTAVRLWLATHGQWLLIWDNLEDLSLLDRFLPPTRRGAILLTTRAHALGTRAVALDLVPMDREEGVLFLLRRAKVLAQTATNEDVRQLARQRPAQYQSAAEVVSEMGGLPLALDQAGAYLESTLCGLPAYLDLFRTQRAALLQQRGAGAREHPASVWTTFTLALAATTERHPAVGDLLRVCALLQTEAIPEELFCLGAGFLGSTLETVCRDALVWNQVVAYACSYSLLHRNPEEQTLSLHRLVQAVLVDPMNEVEQTAWRRRVLGALDAVFPEMLVKTEYSVWKQCERLLPHALACLRWAGIAEDPLVVASLAHKAALYLRARGRYAEAEPLFQRALHLREQVLGPEHSEVATSLHFLAVLHHDQGYYIEAEPLAQRALQIREQVLGRQHPQVATSLNYLAILYGTQGKYTEAGPLLERALQIREQGLGPDHLDLVPPLNNLAHLYYWQGRYREAEPLFQRALSICEQALGTEHVMAARALNNLARLYQKQGKYTEAEPLLRRALHLWEQALGPDHPHVGEALYGLADLSREQGQTTAAEPLYLRALSIFERVLGLDHADVAELLQGLARLYLEQGRYAEAEPRLRRALHLWEQVLGAEHPFVAEALQGLAKLFQQQGQMAAAEPLYLRALSIQEARLGPHHPATASMLYDLALLRQQQGHLNEARSLAEQALSIRAQSLGDAHPNTIATRALSEHLLQEPEGQEKEPDADRPVEQRTRSPRSQKPTAGSVRRGTLPPAPGDPSHPSRLVPANASLPGGSPPGAAEDVAEAETGSGTLSPLPERRPLHIMRVAVRGANEQVAYTRTVCMREVTFTCMICGHTVTERRYPSGPTKYCSEACRAIGAAQRHEARVAQQREKRRIARRAQQPNQQGKDL